MTALEQLEKKRARGRAYYQRHREEIMARQKAYYEDHPEAYEARKQRNRVRHRRWRSENPEKNREQTRRSNAKRRLDPKYRADAVRRARVWREQHPAKHQAHILKRRGISPEQFAELLAAQNGVCAICGETETGPRFKRLAIDHDHATNEIRGLLCHKCNRGLGLFQDRSDLLAAAANYLGKTA